MDTCHGNKAGDACAWWEDESVLLRFISDLIASEMGALRPGGLPLPPLPWRAGLDLRADLDVDSLEMMQIATALVQSIHLHESGIEDYLLARTRLSDWMAIARTGLRQVALRMTFHTSGSTGTPKPCQHTLAGLWQEAMALVPLFAGRRRLYTAVPSHHIYGFIFTVLLPRALGIPPDAVIDVRASSPARLAHALADGDLVIGHPEFWRMVTRAVPRIGAGVFGVTSTAPCPREIRAAVAAAGIETLVQVYGSSETAGVGWRTGDDDAMPYLLLPYLERSEDEAGLVRVLPDGEHLVHTLPDKIEWIDARCFRVHGRADEAVQVAGINVFPSRIRAVLLQHPEVLDASVRLMRTDEGNRLKAFIVPRPAILEADYLHARLDAWVNAHLSAPERPRMFSFGEKLPVNASGKLTDWTLDRRPCYLSKHQGEQI